MTKKPNPKNIKNFNLSHTREFINELRSGIKFRVESPFPNIDGIDMTIQFEGNDLSFKSHDFKSARNTVQYQHAWYGYARTFYLRNDKFIVSVPNGVTSTVGFPAVNSGKISEIEMHEDKGLYYFRSCFFIKKLEANHYLDSQPYQTERVKCASGLIELKIQRKSFFIYHDAEKDFPCLIIECQELISLEEFNLYSELIKYIYGFISGNLIGNEQLIFRFLKGDFLKIESFSFLNLGKGKESFGLTRRTALRNEFGSTNYLIPTTVFSELIEESLRHEGYYRAIKIIVDSYENSLINLASTFSVALETLKNIICENNESEIKPIKSKAVSRSLIKGIKALVEEIPISEFNNKGALLKNIDNNLNRTPNKESLELAFILSGITLNEKDKECIKMRNDFLHGRVPIEDDKNSQKMLKYYVYKLHFLISALILKQTSFSGKILNHAHQGQKEGAVQHSEPLFRDI